MSDVQASALPDQMLVSAFIADNPFPHRVDHAHLRSGQTVGRRASIWSGAYSSLGQAKGRVERANGTLQDRLVKELRLAGVSSITEGNAFLKYFRRDYNARFGRAPTSDHDAHRKLIRAERVRIDDIFSWQESRAVTRSLTLQYDTVIYMIKPGPENDKVAGQHVTVFDYPDGCFKIRYEGRELPYSVFDRLSQIRQADIVNNKRLGATLAMAREAQLESNERRSKSCPSRPFPSASSMQ